MCDHPRRSGCVTVPLFHCLFHDSTTITHFLHEVDPALCRLLQHTYAVCIADNRGTTKSIPAGFFIKTSCTHDDAAFVQALAGIAGVALGTEMLSEWKASYLPARLGLPDGAPLTEQEMLRIIVQQRFKHTGAHWV